MKTALETALNRISPLVVQLKELELKGGTLLDMSDKGARHQGWLSPGASALPRCEKWSWTTPGFDASHTVVPLRILLMVSKVALQ